MKCHIDDLKPTQFAIGFHAVDQKEAKIKKMKHKELKEYLHTKTVPVVVWKNMMFLIDHHHLCAALYRLEIYHVYVTIVKDYGNIPRDLIWNEMAADGYIWAYDSTGMHIKDISIIGDILPKHITDLKDDPFRSLAATIRKMDAYKKTTIPFAEFQWANFLRNKIDSYDIFKTRAVAQACVLAQSDDAIGLPGFIPKADY